MLWAGTTSPHETMEQTRLTHAFVREPAMGWIRHRETLLLWYLEWCSHGGVSKYSQLAYLWQPTLWLQVWWWKSRNDSFWAPRLTFYQCSWGSRVFRCWLLIFEIVLSSRWDHIWCLSHAPPRWSCSYFLYTYSRFWWFFLPILIIFPCCLLSVLVACPCCLFFLPVLFPYPLSMPSSLSFLVFPLVSFTFLLGFVCYRYMRQSFKGTWLGLMSPLRCLAQTAIRCFVHKLSRCFAYGRVFGAFRRNYSGALRRHYSVFCRAIIPVIWSNISSVLCMWQTIRCFPQILSWCFA